MALSMPAVLSTGQPAREEGLENTGSWTEETNYEPGVRTDLGIPIRHRGARRGLRRSDSDRGRQHRGAEQLNASRDRLHQLARQQMGLRRLAGLVAREAEPAEVFAAEAAVCLNAYNATMGRFNGDEIVIEALGRAQLELRSKPAVGERFPMAGDHIAAMICRTGRPDRCHCRTHPRDGCAVPGRCSHRARAASLGRG
ncbi:hypothetical protein [Mycobacterium sp. Aquia_213]|uniref:hypothetical protein n=1 Tax=Mycobacterium sp. Aquia_213 TaxID=2991728 RepID=UPI002270D0FF|nr:hypothetical protein [Mycobacterium sp. Aquia_213]WAC92086.1 hypothetical protein LMQ14_02425 [Mycobacterium sp. Aquia_213]